MDTENPTAGYTEHTPIPHRRRPGNARGRALPRKRLNKLNTCNLALGRVRQRAYGRKTPVSLSPHRSLSG